MASKVKSLSISLKEEPAKNFSQWLIAVQELAASYCRSIYGAYGLLHYVLTTAEWDLEHTNNGDATKQKPLHQLPATPHGVQSAPNISMYERKLKDFSKEADEVAELRFLVIDSLGEQNISHITEGTNVLRKHTLLHIIVSMRAKHNVLTTSQLDEVRDTLKMSLDDTNKLETLISRHRNTHSQLAEQGSFTTLSEIQKLEYLIGAIQHIPAVAGAIIDYRKSHPVASTQTFNALTTYLIEQVPNMLPSAKAAGYAASAAAVADAKYDALAAQLAELTATIKKMGKPSSSGGAKSIPGLPDCYCYVHGTLKGTSHDGLGGIACNTMKANPTKYTTAMRSAKSHTDVAGGCTKIYGQ